MEHATIQKIRERLKADIDWPIGKTESPLKVNTTRIFTQYSLQSIDRSYRQKANCEIPNYIVPVRTVIEKSLNDLFDPILEIITSNLEKALNQYRNDKLTLEKVENEAKRTHHFINLYNLLQSLENAMVTELYVTSEIPKTLIISGDIEDKGEPVKVMISASISE